LRTKSSREPAVDHELVLASLTEAVVVFNNDGRITSVNQAAESLIGRSRSRLAGRGAEGVFRESAWIHELVRRITTVADITLRDEGELIRPDGPLGVLAVVSLLRDREGQPNGVVLTLHDHGARRQIHTDDIARARLQTLNHLVASVAHELNNPLAGIRGAAQFLGDKLATDEQLADYATMIVRQADRMSKLVEVLLQLEAAPPERDVLNIHRVLTEVLFLETTVANDRGVKLSHEFDPSLPAIRGDSAQLQQLFLNLLKNAIAAAPAGGGAVSVRTRMESGFYVERGATKVRYIDVAIRDNGPGLDPLTRANLFTPFFSRTPGGHGLGLTIAHHIASTHNGHIRAENVEGGGACFHVLLPASERTAID